jgi:sec-independent protein translocase protein TatA
MGLGGLSLWKLIIVLLIVVLIFGTKWLKTLAADLGGAAKSLRDASTDPPPPRQIKLDNAEPDAEFPERKQRGGRA